jgi:hypothetical protein
MRCFPTLRALGALCVFSACIVGEGLAPSPDPDPDPDPDPAGPDAAPDPDPAASVSGMVMDWATLAPIANASLTTDGLTPPLSATSDAAGMYAIDGVPLDTLFTIAASYDGNYYPTVNARAKYLGTPMTHDVWVASKADIGRQYATVGLAMQPGTAFVEGNLLKGDGTPRDGVLLADVTLTDALGAPVGDGPYFFGALGDLDPALTVSTVYGGRARVAFLNVPPGTYTLSALYPADGDGGGGGGNLLKTSVVESALDTVHMLNVNDKLDAGGGGGGGGV